MASLRDTVREYQDDLGTVKYYAQIHLQFWQNSVCTEQGKLTWAILCNFLYIKKRASISQVKSRLFSWCTRQESNLWPSESESDALSN